MQHEGLAPWNAVPKLKSLSLGGFTSMWFNTLREMWANFPSLEKLKMTFTLDIYRDSNFDAEFCGIYEEEAAILRGKYDAYLEAVNIVASFPPSNYLRGTGEIYLPVDSFCLIFLMLWLYHLTLLVGLKAIEVS